MEVLINSYGADKSLLTSSNVSADINQKSMLYVFLSCTDQNNTFLILIVYHRGFGSVLPGSPGKYSCICIHFCNLNVCMLLYIINNSIYQKCFLLHRKEAGRRRRTCQVHLHHPTHNCIFEKRICLVVIISISYNSDHIFS